MNSILAVSCLLALACADAGFVSPVFAPTVTQQYHAQDELGQYTYGYSGGPSAKEETRTADGITRGSYSYIDGHGLIQSASYVSDPVNGFRVAATNLPVGPSAPAVVAAPVFAAPAPVVSHVPSAAVLPGPVVPQETPEVVAAKVAHFAAHNEAIARLGRKRRSIAAYAAPLAIAAPLNRFAYSTVSAHSPLVAPVHVPQLTALPYAAPYVAHPAAVAVPAIAKSTFHAQDELGQYSYGYTDGLSAKQESRTADGITTGGYSYVDAHGIVQKVNYVADAAGFRVAATNLPVGPA